MERLWKAFICAVDNGVDTMSKTSKIYIIAGEASGDLIGSKIINSLRILQPMLNFVGIGGDLMEAKGLQSLFLMSNISLIGFLEIIPHIFRLRKLIKKTTEDILQQNPDILITIDSPGFTYRVAAAVRKQKPNLKMLHIVAPSVWAYKADRAAKYAKIYNHLLTLLPFEPPYFERVGLRTSYVGHPVLEQEFYADKNIMRQSMGVKGAVKLICVTPGSRIGEIKTHLPIFCQALNLVHHQYPNLKIVFILANEEHKKLAMGLLKEAKFEFTCSLERLKSFAAADIGLAKSGTNTLEIAATTTPMIVAYKVNLVSYLLIKLMIKIKYICLINIIADKKIIEEYIQSECNPTSIALGLSNLLTNPDLAKKQLSFSKKILLKLGLGSSSPPSMRAAKIILSLLNN